MYIRMALGGEDSEDSEEDGQVGGETADPMPLIRDEGSADNI